jgi:long-chain acyl-CoA synthetase
VVDEVKIDVDKDIASLPYTGGTTGNPKGVILTHKNLVACRNEFLEVVNSFFRDKRHVIAALLPFYHIYGQVVIMGCGLSRGDTLVVFPRLNVDALLKAIEKFRITIFYGIPALYNIILNHDRLDLYDLSSVEYWFSGADLLPLDLERRWRERIGRDIIQGYGLTESSAVVAVNPLNRYKVDAIGIPLPNTDIGVVKVGTQEFLDIGKAGELVVSAPQITPGYWRKPDVNNLSFFEADGRRWFRTGDIVWLDEEGYIHFVDRAKDIIKYKGYLVAAAEIETVLYDHPSVKEAAVIGVPDPVVGERIKAYVVLHEDARGVTAHDLIKWCRDRLAPYKVPHMIEIRDMLPKSTVGKILRRELRDEERKRVTKTMRA